MEEIKTEPVDFVREFQEYLTQQTHHVNMISGSVCAEKESEVPYQAGENKIHCTVQQNNNLLSPQMSKLFYLCIFFPVAPRNVQNGGDPPSVEVNLSTDEGSDVQMDGPERTCDGKYKCSYCNYANKGMARLIEHIRIHTGKPFFSAPVPYDSNIRKDNSVFCDFFQVGLIYRSIVLL